MGTAPPVPVYLAPTGDLPAWVLDDPPVVDVLEGVAGDLLLVGTPSSIFIPEDNRQAVTSLRGGDADWLIGCWLHLIG